MPICIVTLMTTQEAKDLMLKTGYRDSMIEVLILCIMLRVLVIAMPLALIALMIVCAIFPKQEPVTHSSQPEPIQVEKPR